MRTVSLTDEERKANKISGNKLYYQKHKDLWKDYNSLGHTVYKLSGFANDMIFIGITKTFNRRMSEHKKAFGDHITHEVILHIQKTISPDQLLALESLLVRHYGSSRCIKGSPVSEEDLPKVLEKLAPLTTDFNAEQKIIWENLKVCASV
jgi:hypothetical protein